MLVETPQDSRSHIFQHDLFQGRILQYFIREKSSDETGAFHWVSVTAGRTIKWVKFSVLNCSKIWFVGQGWGLRLPSAGADLQL